MIPPTAIHQTPAMSARSVLIAGVLVGLSVHTQAADLLVQTRVLPGKEIRAGQPVHYEVDVLTDTWLTGGAEFPALQLAGTLISFEGSQGRSIQRTIGGKRYFGVTYSYRLIPLEPGVITLPALQLQAPVGQEDAPLSARVPEQSFAVQALPAAEAANITLLAGDVSLSQSLAPSGKDHQAGQPLVREIRVRAEQAMALAIPPLAAPSSGNRTRQTDADLGNLTGQPLPAEVDTITDARGNTIGGERIERIRYLPEHGGSFQLPALTLHWWDIDEGRAKQSTLPALEIEVIATGPARSPWPWLILLPVAGLAGWALKRSRGRLHSVIKALTQRLRQRWQHSLPGARSQAIAQLKRDPRELTGLYRLIERQTQSVSVRHSLLSPSIQNRLLSDLSGYYRKSPAPEQSTRSLIRLIRRLK